MSNTELVGKAYSYMRFSSPRQERGDSIRRQTEARDKWLERNPRVELAAEDAYQELGTSSFRGKHRLEDKTALKQFITAVESGRVKPGSFLIVESFDRLTREEFGDAAEFVLGLVNRGIRIVQLSPVEVVLDKPVDLTKALVLVVELTRGHGESKRKSDTIGAAWANKREACRDSGKLVTKGAKAWLKIEGGKFVFKPGAKALIRRIFKMTKDGYGARAVAQVLNREGVKTWTGKPWYEAYIRVILHGREVLGEYRQAERGEDGRRVIDPEPVLNYYPKAVSEAEWSAAQAAARGRDNRGGRPTKVSEHVNIFGVLLYDARSGDRLHIESRGERRVLMPEGYRHRGETGVSFPLPTLEREVLKRLAELDPREIEDREEGPGEVAELSAKLTRLDTQVKALADQFDGDDIPEIAAKVRAKHAERKALAEALEAAKRRAASPLSSALGECRGLAEALDSAKDVRDVRVRLRQALGRIAQRITCLFVDRGAVRLAVVQIAFESGTTRTYLIHHTRAQPGTPAERRPAKSGAISGAAVAALEKFDLREPRGLAAWERLLSNIDVAALV